MNATHAPAPAHWTPEQAEALEWAHRQYDELKATECRVRWDFNPPLDGVSHVCTLPKGHDGDHRCVHEQFGVADQFLKEMFDGAATP